MAISADGIEEHPSTRDAGVELTHDLLLWELEHKHLVCAVSYIVDLSDLDHTHRMLDLARSPRQFGNAVRNARRRLGWTQSALGERAGLRQETISLVETGNAATRLDTVLAILAALDLELQIAPRSRTNVEGAF